MQTMTRVQFVVISILVGRGLWVVLKYLGKLSELLQEMYLLPHLGCFPFLLFTDDCFRPEDTEKAVL